MQVTLVADNGKTVGIAVLNPKQFSSGSKGYFGSFKVEVSADERYQGQAQLVLIGSKPGSKASKPAANANGPVKTIKAGK